MVKTMAVQASVIKSALSLKYKEGVDESGKDIFKTKKFSNVKTSAADADIYAVADTFSSLMKYPVEEILRNDDSMLINL
jgi:hypothetical protein